MDELISRRAAIDAIEFGIRYVKAFNKTTGEIKELFQKENDELREAVERVKELPSAHGDAEFISWLLDEIWDDEMWELNYRAFPELLCRRLVKAGWLKEDGGKYVRLDK